MKKSLAGAALALVFLGAMLTGAPGVQAADADADSNVVTQAELARMLVRVMGLGRFVDPGASDYKYFEILSQNMVFPKDNWDADAPVEKGLLARLMVMALRMTDRVEDLDDYQACIMALKEANIPIDTVGMALANTKGWTRTSQLTNNTIGPQIDPIVRREPMSFNPSDEPTGGADADGGVAPLQAELILFPASRQEVAALIVALPLAAPTKKKPSKPVTPTNPLPPDYCPCAD